MAEGGKEQSVMPATNPQSQEGEEGISDEVRAPMCQTHKQPFEFYCQNHNTPACGTCNLIDHRKCWLQDLEQAAKEKAGKGQHALQQMRQTEADMKKIGEVMGSEIEALEKQKEAAIEKIKRKMKELEALGEKKIAEVEEKFQQEREGLDREARDIKKSTMLVQKSVKELERVTKDGSEEEIFLATRQAEDDISKYQDIVSESSQMSHTDLLFEVDDRLTDITSIGNVQVEKSTISVDLTPDVFEVLNTQQNEIRWFNILPSGQMILLDSGITSEQCQLLLYSTNKKLLSQLDLPGDVISADLLDDHRLIVPLLNKPQLQIVNMVDNNLTKGSLIKTDVHLWLIQKYSDSSVLVLCRCKQLDVKFRLQIIDLTGKTEEHIKPSTDLQTPCFMRMSQERNSVYIIDQNKCCLGFNLQGDTIFHYTNTDIASYYGLAVDPYGALFLSICKRDQGMCVIMLSPTGQFLRQINIRDTFQLQCISNKVYLVSINDLGEQIIGYFYM